MNNNIFIRSFLIMAVLLVTCYKNLLAENFSNKTESEIQNSNTSYPSLMVLKNSCKNDMEKINQFLLMSKDTSEKERNNNYKSPWLAFFLSYLFPSGGQFYNGEYSKALLIDAAVAVGLGLFFIGAMSVNYDSESIPDNVIIFLYSGMALGGFAWVYSLVDAPISAIKINKRIRQANNKRYSINLGYSKFTKSYLVGIKFNF